MGHIKRAGLSPYEFCPLGDSSRCKFEDQPLTVCSKPDDLVVYSCKTCGHGVTRPAMRDVSELYEGRTTQDYQGQDGKIATTIKRLAFDRQARQVLRQAGIVQGTVIDFGCGSGLLTSAIGRQLPPPARLVALDFFDDPPSGLSKTEYLPFSSSESLQGKADLVLCFHVLEHDDDPGTFLSKITSLCRPGGTMVVEVPNVNCIWSKFFGKNWDNWYLPFHRVHFSRRSLNGLVKRIGLEIIAEYDVCVPSIGRSIARFLGRQNGLFFVIVSAVTFPIQLALEKLLNSPSAIRIVVRNGLPSKK